MIRIKLLQQWTTKNDGVMDLDARLLSALEAIQATGSISQAANSKTKSTGYRDTRRNTAE